MSKYKSGLFLIAEWYSVDDMYIGAQLHSFICKLSMSAFLLSKQSWIVEQRPYGLQSLKNYLALYRKKFAYHCSRMWVSESQVFCPSVYIFISSTYNSTWHILGTQSVLVKWMNEWVSKWMSDPLNVRNLILSKLLSPESRTGLSCGESQVYREHTRIRRSFCRQREVFRHS